MPPCFRRPRRLVLLGAALALFWTSTAAADGGSAAFGLRPATSDPSNPATRSYFVFDAAPGQTVQSTVLVRNGGTLAGAVDLAPVDATTGATSGTVFRDTTTPPQAVGAWIHLDQQHLTLAPGEQRAVGFTVTIPATATAGQHVGGLAAEDAAPQPSTTGGNLRVNVRTLVQTAVQINLPGPRVDQVTLGDVTAGGQAGDQTLLLGLTNAGNQMVKPTGTLTVTDAQDQVVQTLPLQLDTFLPGTTIQYPVHIQKQALGDGQYQATLHLTYGLGGVTDTQRAFRITPAQVAQVFPTSAPLAPPIVAGAGHPGVAVQSGLPVPAALAIGGSVLVLLGLGAGLGLTVVRRRP
jgi:hypothetical protein